MLHADRCRFLAAALLELICIGLVLPTYVGWWKLGRSVSFSPLEIAKVRVHPCPHVRLRC